MKGSILISALVLLLAACGNDAERRATEMYVSADTKLVQLKKINGFNIQLQYLPQGIQQEEWRFKLTVQEPGETNQRESKALSYGLDTLFSLVQGRDTIPALHAMREANGNIGGMTYILVFPQVSDAGGDLRLHFSDWLFTQRYMEFPLSVSSIKKLDSLSARL